MSDRTVEEGAMLLTLWFVFLGSNGNALVASAWQATGSISTIEVREPKDVVDVQALNRLVTALSKDVTACVDGGKAPATCRCQYPPEITALRTGYAEALKQHPAWKEQVLSYQYVNTEGRNMSGVLSIQTLRRQLEGLKCE
jgi:hypothetical protein